MRIGRISKYTAEGFDLATAQGMRFIEICCNNEEEARAFIEHRSDILAQIQRTGLDVSSVGRWNHDILSDGKIHGERLKVYKEQLECAAQLGARTFVCGVNYDESISLYRNYTLAIDVLGSLIEQAKGRLRVAVQNCHWNNFITRPRDWDILFSELPALCLKYDPSHAYACGGDYLAEMSDYAERIAHVHIKGILRAGKRRVDDPPAGMDDIRWPSVFAVLYARGYDGDLSIEPHSETWQGALGDFGVRFTRDYIQGFLHD